GARADQGDAMPADQPAVPRRGAAGAGRPLVSPGGPVRVHGRGGLRVCLRGDWAGFHVRPGAPVEVTTMQHNINVVPPKKPTREPDPPRPRYCIGLDLGQSQDYSALAVVETNRRPDGELLHGVRFLKRWPLGTRYTKIVRQVCELCERPPFD